MLVIPRRINDQIVIGDVTVTVVAIDERAGKVKLAFGTLEEEPGDAPELREMGSTAQVDVGGKREIAE